VVFCAAALATIYHHLHFSHPTRTYKQQGRAHIAHPLFYSGNTERAVVVAEDSKDGSGAPRPRVLVQVSQGLAWASAARHLN
jgi:hypothetical protein